VKAARGNEFDDAIVHMFMEAARFCAPVNLRGVSSAWTTVSYSMGLSAIWGTLITRYNSIGNAANETMNL